MEGIGMYDLRLKLRYDSAKGSQLFYWRQFFADREHGNLNVSKLFNVRIFFTVIPHDNNRVIALSIHRPQKVE